MAFRSRRVWIVVATFGVVFLGTLVLGLFLPNLYRSESLIQVVPQRVPENLVRSTITEKIDERLPAIQQQILSRTRLELIIQDFGLYQKERQTGLMEDIVGKMRDSIQVSIVKGDAFRVAYVSDNARTAMKVTERLASLIVEENLRDREVLADGASQFIDSQLEDARRRLLDHEKKLEEYRRQYAGELPEQLNGTLQAIQSMQTQLTNLSESISRDRDRRLVLERQLVELAQDSDTAATSQSVVAMPSPAEKARQARMRDLKNEIEGIDKQAAAKDEAQKRIQRAIGDYQKRVDATPSRESDLLALNRDYDTISKIYTTLLQKGEEAKVASNLERRQLGEQFKVLDAARLPERPFSPNRLGIDAAGAAGGLLLCLAVMAFLNYRDLAGVSEPLIERLEVRMPASSLLHVAGLQAVLMTTVVLFQSSYAGYYGSPAPTPDGPGAFLLVATASLGYVALLEAACGVVIGLNEASPSRQFARGSIAAALGSIVALLLLFIAITSLEAGHAPVVDGERGQLPALLPLVAPLLGVALSPVAGVLSVITGWAHDRSRPPSV